MKDNKIQGIRRRNKPDRGMSPTDTGISRLRVEIAKKTIGTKDYKVRRLDDCHANIIHFAMLERSAKTITERKFCQDMIEMYVKRYNWYLR